MSEMDFLAYGIMVEFLVVSRLSHRYCRSPMGTAGHLFDELYYAWWNVNLLYILMRLMSLKKALLIDT